MRIPVISILFALVSMTALAAEAPANKVGQTVINNHVVDCYKLSNSIVCSDVVPTEPPPPNVYSIFGWFTISKSIVRYVIGGVLGLLFLIYLLEGLIIVDQWERAPLKRWGKYVGTLGPGVTWREPFTTRIIQIVSIRDEVENLHAQLKIEPSSVQTHDNVPVKFRVILTYRVANPEPFVLAVEYAAYSLRTRALTIVSGFIGSTELDAILHDRHSLYASIKEALQVAVGTWGIEIIAIELRDIEIADVSIQEAIAMKARAQKEAEAEMVRASMQSDIAKKLDEAGRAYDIDGWRLKGYETLLELCRSAENNTIIIPNDLVASIAKIVGQ